MTSIRQVGDAVEIDVIVQPRASKEEIAGIQGGALKVRLTAPPVEGEANEALVRLVAKLAGLPRSAVTIVRGKTGRRKTLRILGLEAGTLRSRLGLP